MKEIYKTVCVVSGSYTPVYKISSKIGQFLDGDVSLVRNMEKFGQFSGVLRGGIRGLERERVI
ncbi:hypothetical protein ACFLXB_04160 [Chloroflexota bacterium]